MCDIVPLSILHYWANKLRYGYSVVCLVCSLFSPLVLFVEFSHSDAMAVRWRGDDDGCLPAEMMMRRYAPLTSHLHVRCRTKGMSVGIAYPRVCHVEPKLPVGKVKKVHTHMSYDDKVQFIFISHH